MDRMISVALIVLVVCTAAACAAAPAAATSTPTVQPTSPPSPTPTHTPLPPTDTPLPTDTPVPPTDTPLPPTATFTAVPTDTSTPEPIACSGAPSGGRNVRLTIVNQSGYEVFITLVKCGEDAFYYLTVPAGTLEKPETKVFTVLAGTYQRTILQCDGVESRGLIPLDNSLRLAFTPCGARPTASPTP